MKNATIYILTAVLFCGCSFINDVGLYAQNNPFVVDVAVRQAVFRYIDAGETETDKNARAVAVVDVLRDVDGFLQGNPTTRAEALVAVVEAAVNWENLSVADQLLARDVLASVRLNLQSKQREGLLNVEAVVSIRALISTAVNTAAMF